MTFLAKNASQPVEALPKLANQLRDMSEKTGDGEFLEFANILMQGAAEEEAE